ncbi:MAG: hypothetical protein U9O94_01450 [Nanoarchaeota archaeon]|nr:hypothetical protein [Nanoarchaeota archaeon]
MERNPKNKFEILEKKLEKRKQELIVIDSNHKQNLKDYGNKISSMDKEVSALNTVRLKLINEIQDLENNRDSRANSIRAEAKVLREEAKAFLANVKNKDKALNEKTEDLLKRISSEEQKMAQKILKLADRESRVRAAEVDIRDRRKESEVIFSEAEDALSDAREYSKDILDKNKSIDRLKVAQETKLLNLEAKERDLDAKIKTNNILEAQLRDLKNDNQVILLGIEADGNRLSKEREEFRQAKDTLEIEYEDKMKDITKQMEVNSLRSIELDVGFKKLNDQSTSVKREIKKLENIKKQLLK